MSWVLKNSLLFQFIAVDLIKDATLSYNPIFVWNSDIKNHFNFENVVEDKICYQRLRYKDEIKVVNGEGKWLG